MSRWLPDEEQALIKIRQKLKLQIAQQTPFPEVVGDRRLIRFYRGNERDVDRTIIAYAKFLEWRKEYNVDRIRQDIVYGTANSPMKFPYGAKIIELSSQIVFTANAVDKYNHPLVVETFNFSPKEFMEKTNIDEFLTFLLYSLEYRALSLEQLSDIREKEYLITHPNSSDRKNPYGVIVYLCNIRDLKGVTLAHLGAQGRLIVSSALKLGLPNYPDFLGVGYFLNVPWIFNAFWYFIKQLLDADTLRKINISASDSIKVLLEGLTIENIPKLLGGNYELYNEPFDFDISKDGPLWYEGAPLPERLKTGKLVLSPTSSTLRSVDSPSYLQNKQKKQNTSVSKFSIDSNTVESKSDDLSSLPITDTSNQIIPKSSTTKIQKPISSYPTLLDTFNNYYYLKIIIIIIGLSSIVLYVTIYPQLIHPLVWFLFPMIVAFLLSKDRII